MNKASSGTVGGVSAGKSRVPIGIFVGAVSGWSRGGSGKGDNSFAFGDTVAAWVAAGLGLWGCRYKMAARMMMSRQRIRSRRVVCAFFCPGAKWRSQSVAVAKRSVTSAEAAFCRDLIKDLG